MLQRLEQLHTVDQVIEKLGGTAEAGRLLGISMQQVSSWRDRGRIAFRYYLVMTDELARLGYAAPSRLWRIDPLPAKRRKAVA